MRISRAPAIFMRWSSRSSLTGIRALASGGMKESVITAEAFPRLLSRQHRERMRPCPAPGAEQLRVGQD